MTLWEFRELPPSWFPPGWNGGRGAFPGRWCLLPVVKR